MGQSYCFDEGSFTMPVQLLVAFLMSGNIHPNHKIEVEEFIAIHNPKDDDMVEIPSCFLPKKINAKWGADNVAHYGSAI